MEAGLPGSAKLDPKSSPPAAENQKEELMKNMLIIVGICLLQAARAAGQEKTFHFPDTTKSVELSWKHPAPEPKMLFRVYCNDRTSETSFYSMPFPRQSLPQTSRFQVTAIDSVGNESQKSETLVCIFDSIPPVPPQPPPSGWTSFPYEADINVLRQRWIHNNSGAISAGIDRLSLWGPQTSPEWPAKIWFIFKVEKAGWYQVSVVSMGDQMTVIWPQGSKTVDLTLTPEVQKIKVWFNAGENMLTVAAAKMGIDVFWIGTRWYTDDTTPPGSPTDLGMKAK